MIDYLAHFSKYEGLVNHLYLDTDNVVTIGVGCEVFDPLDLKLVRFSDGLPAIRAEVFSDYNAVKALPAGKSASFYASVCRLRMQTEDITALFYSRLAPFLVVNSWLPAGAPDAAKLVMVDRAFIMGLDGVQSKFPKFTNAMKVGNWHAASQECAIEGQKDRNDWARQVLESMAGGS